MKIYIKHILFNILAICQILIVLLFSLIYNASKLATFVAFYFYFNDTQSLYFFIEFFNKLAVRFCSKKLNRNKICICICSIR